MWKRLRSGRKPSPERPSLSVTESAPPAERPSDQPRHYSLPDSTLPLLPKDPALRRRESEQSAISDIHGQLFASQRSAGHQRQRSRDRREDPLGLQVLHAPPERSVDILFIHGLGGTSLRTWCRNRDLDNLWPQLWLPEDPDFSRARILSFGYNAHFGSKAEHATLTIGDFANDLLFRMKYGETGAERLGQVPIIVVAHSMGGLVFKKAFIHGFMNDEFRDIISSIKAVLFLATPHRGTNLAETLNKVLTSSLFGHSSKEYVSELARRSPTIDDLNESFRHYASKLKIFSFYETLATSVGPMSFMILEKYSSVLGYPNEISQPLNANHHDVCKFTSIDDPNYASVVGALRSLVESTHSSNETESDAEEELQQVRNLLRISGPPDADLAVGRATRRPGTCENFLQNEKLSEWMKSTSYPLLWVHASPGNGKSTLCTAVVDHLLDTGQRCAYFFFKHADQQKRSLSNMLRSIAYQLSLCMPLYRRMLVGLAQSGIQVQNSDAITVWKRLYGPALAELALHEDIHWILDGIDESESSKQVVELISSLGGLRCPIRLLVFSRPLPVISKSFQRAQKKIPIIDLPLSRVEDDIRLVVTEEIEFLPSDDQFKIATINEIIERSQGNFLWVNLILKRVVSCHRQDQVKTVLDSTPAGMDELYDRMWDLVTTLELPDDRNLARILLSWAMYAKAPLTVEELSDPYTAELTSVMDLKHTTSQVCGQFVNIDSLDRVILVHQSAHDYLQKSNHDFFSLDPESVHEELFQKCLTALYDRNLRQKITALRFPQFLPYAATSWAYHLQYCSPSSNNVLDLLVKFFGGPYPLTWIHYLAMSGHLSELVGVSRRLTAYVRKWKKAEADRPPMLHRLVDVSLIETWIVDLMKLPAKFGRYLSEDPSLIYRCIPALCPTSSAINQKFVNNSSVSLSVSGLSTSEWDDCLGRVSASTGRAIRLAASAFYLAVGSDRPKGSITIWHTDLFDECKSFNINEHVYSLTFNEKGSLLACYGVSNTYVWRVGSWSLAQKSRNPHQERAIDFKFDEHDSLMMVSDFRRIYKLSTGLEAAKETFWLQLSSALLDEPAVPDGMVLGTPSSVSFNSDCTQIAVAYRNFPLSVWDLDSSEMIARLRRKAKPGQGAVHSYTGTNKVVWHPSGTQLIGIYGKIFKWSPLDDTYDEIRGETGAVPHEIQCSPNGLVFLTSDVEGSIKIYDVAQMVMIYKLTSEDSINQLCFSPNSLKFYDLRGAYCNIWEPNCLLRLADAAADSFSFPDNASDSFWSETEDTQSTSITFAISESHADSKPAITAIAAGTRADQLLAYGNRRGVEIYDPRNSKRQHIVQASFGMGVEHLQWSHDHSQLAYSLVNGAVTVKVIDSKTLWESQPPSKSLYMEKKPPEECGRTEQLLFHATGKMLLVYGLKRSRVLDLLTGEVAATRDTPGGENGQWQLHPSRHDTLICISIAAVSIFSWQLQPTSSIALELPSPPPKTLAIDAILASYSPRLLLLRTVVVELNRPQYGLLIIPTTNIYESEPSQNQNSIKPVTISLAIAEVASYPVGLASDGRFVFIDRNLWVCTAQLRDTKAAVMRHFFIPHDLVTSSGLQLCHMLRDGTLLCPSKGEVAIIHSDIISEW